MIAPLKGSRWVKQKCRLLLGERKTAKSYTLGVFKLRQTCLF